MKRRSQNKPRVRERRKGMSPYHRHSKAPFLYTKLDEKIKRLKRRHAPGN